MPHTVEEVEFVPSELRTALVQLVQAIIGATTGETRIGDVRFALTENGLSFEPQSMADWDLTQFRMHLETQMKEHSDVGELMKKEDVLLALDPILTGSDNAPGLDEREQSHTPSHTDPPLPPQQIGEDPRTTMASYREGGLSRRGIPIRKIISRTHDWIVFIGENQQAGTVNYEYWPTTPQYLNPALATSSQLKMLAECSLSPMHVQLVNSHLAFALASAFELPEDGDITKPFAPVELLIRRKSMERAQYYYVFFGGCFAVIMCALILLAYNIEWTGLIRFRDFLFGAFAGTVGASVSVIQRGKNLRFEPYAGSFFLAFQGMIRITLGLIFGVFTVIAVKAGVLTTVVNDNIYLLLMFCVVAGISERFVPDLIERLEPNANQAAPRTDERGSSERSQVDHPNEPHEGATP